MPVIIGKLIRSNKIFKIIGFVILVALGGAWVYSNHISVSQSEVTERGKPSDLLGLFEEQQSGVMVNAVGDVTRILANDNKGVRHQRFIISIPEGLSLLVAHNIDLAPSIPLNVGDQVKVYGQYEWNHKGGLIHWTHRDPKKIHPGGWVIHNNIKYE